MEKLFIAVSNINQIQKVEKINEVIYVIGLSDYSQLGNIDLDQFKRDFLNLDDLVKKNICLEWDLIETDNDLRGKLEIFENLLIELNIQNILLQDLGLIQYFKEKNNINVIINLGSRLKNKFALKQLEKQFPGSLKILLPIEISKEQVIDFKKEFNFDFIVNLFSPINLFYSPRKLLTAVSNKFKENEIIRANSEESPHKGFKVVEGKHGTTMLNSKDHCLFDELETFKESNINQGFVDLRSSENSSEDLVIAFLKNEIDFSELKSKYPGSLIKSFFRKNKSKILFKKLNNEHILRKDENYFGRVISLINKKYMLVDIEDNAQKFQKNNYINMNTSSGKIKTFKLSDILDLEDQYPVKVNKGDIVKINYISGATPNSKLYLNNEKTN